MKCKPPKIRRLFDSKRIVITGLALFTIVTTTPFAFRDPDPHHDGIQYGAALGVSEGLHLQSEVFSQYGPVTAWIQGMTLWLFGPELIWIRLLHVFLVMAIAIAMYLILIRTFGLSALAALAPIAWVASSPDWTVERPYYQFWPWPSLLFEFFAVITLLLWLKSREMDSFQQGQTLYMSGVLVGLSGFTRSQNGLFLFLAMAVVLLVIDRIKIGGRQRFLFFSLGTLSAGGAILAYLAITSSLDDFVDQAIFGPATVYGGKLIDIIYLCDKYFIPALLFSLLAFFVYRIFTAGHIRWMIAFSILAGSYLALILGLFTNLTSTQVNKFLSHTSYQGDLDYSPIFVSSLAAVAVTFIPFMLFAHQIVMNDSSRSNFEMSRRRRRILYLKSLMISFLTILAISQLVPVRDPYRLLAFAMLTIPLAVFVYQVSSSFDGKSKGSRNRFQVSSDLVEPLAISLVAIASISQLIPNHDPYHLWWASPITIVSLLISSAVLVRNRTALIRTATLLSVLSISLSTYPWFQELSEPRVQIKAGSLKYMFVTEAKNENYEAILKMLDSVESNSASFMCKDGLVSTWTGRYMASSPNFVDWAFGTSDRQLSQTKRFFACFLNQWEAEAWANANGYRLQGGAQAYLSAFSDFYLVEVLKD
jgi:hypothetical protein